MLLVDSESERLAVRTERRTMHESGVQLGRGMFLSRHDVPKPDRCVLSVTTKPGEQFAVTAQGNGHASLHGTAEFPFRFTGRHIPKFDHAVTSRNQPVAVRTE